jgi:hypothetical protein
MSLLIIQCPLRPFTNSTSHLQSSEKIDHFSWCLKENGAELKVSPMKIGVGAVESMPYADSVLVLMPTLDVRLIEVKVPPVNEKKLHLVLPSLIEEHLLSALDSVDAQALALSPGKTPLLRTVAIIDRAWFLWLVKQLSLLISHQVRLIPDCFLLEQQEDTSNTSTDKSISIAYARNDRDLIFTMRTGDQTGVSWIERSDSEPTLPSQLNSRSIQEFSWDWLVPQVQLFLESNLTNSISTLGVNLLPKSFRANARIIKSSLIRKSTTPNLSSIWTNKSLWIKPVRWAIVACTIYIFGFGLHLTWLITNNWRWGHVIDVAASQSLMPISSYSLTEDNQELGVLTSFVKTATMAQRSQGLTTDADFANIALKLEKLKSRLGLASLQKIEYDGFGADFEIKPSSTVNTSEELVIEARNLGFFVSPLGGNRYRIEPYSGLGSGL